MSEQRRIDYTYLSMVATYGARRLVIKLPVAPEYLAEVLENPELRDYVMRTLRGQHLLYLETHPVEAGGITPETPALITWWVDADPTDLFVRDVPAPRRLDWGIDVTGPIDEPATDAGDQVAAGGVLPGIRAEALGVAIAAVRERAKDLGASTSEGRLGLILATLKTLQDQSDLTFTPDEAIDRAADAVKLEMVRLNQDGETTIDNQQARYRGIVTAVLAAVDRSAMRGRWGPVVFRPCAMCEARPGTYCPVCCGTGRVGVDVAPFVLLDAISEHLHAATTLADSGQIGAAFDRIAYVAERTGVLFQQLAVLLPEELTRTNG